MHASLHCGARSNGGGGNLLHERYCAAETVGCGSSSSVDTAKGTRGGPIVRLVVFLCLFVCIILFSPSPSDFPRRAISRGSRLKLPLDRGEMWACAGGRGGKERGGGGVRTHEGVVMFC